MVLFTALGSDPASARLQLAYASQIKLSTGADGVVRPGAVTCDARSGEIVITESHQMGVHFFNPAGIEVARATRFAGLVSPRDASIDALGRTVVLNLVDGRQYELVRLDLAGEPDAYLAAHPGGDFDPQHLIVLRDGHYLSVDADRGRLVKHDSESGAVIWQTSLSGDLVQTDEVDAMHLGRPVEAVDGRIALPGGELRNVTVLSADGEVQVSFGRFGSAPGRLVFPVAAAFGPDNTLLVLDRMRHKILVFGEDYVFENEFGSLGSAPGAFYHPVAMSATTDNRLLVAQGYLGRVQVFNILSDEDR